MTRQRADLPHRVSPRWLLPITAQAAVASRPVPGMAVRLAGPARVAEGAAQEHSVQWPREEESLTLFVF